MRFWWDGEKFWCPIHYCISLLRQLPAVFLSVANTKRHDHITITLQSLHWLKIPEWITCKLVSVIYDVLRTAKPSYHSSILTIRPARSIRSSRLITLYRPAVTSSRTILNAVFRILWNSLPAELRCPKDRILLGTNLLSRSTFLWKLMTHLIHKSYPGSSKICIRNLANPWPQD